VHPIRKGPRCPLALTNASHLRYGTDWPWTPEAAVTALAAQLRATSLLGNDEVAALMTTNGLPLPDRFS
jgi:hypothetical protein